MRLIGSFETEKEAYGFYSFLLKQGIQSIYEPFIEEKSTQKQYRIWVYDENDFETALEWLQKFKQNPSDAQFQGPEVPLSAAPPPPNYQEISQAEESKWQPVRSLPTRERRFPFSLTYLIIILCGFLFMWNSMQEETLLQEKGPIGEQLALTPLMKTLFFDVPASYQYIQQVLDTFPVSTYKEEKDIPPDAVALIKQAEKDAPSWRGIYTYLTTPHSQPVPMFEKIRQGQFWRLFTPCLLHRDFLHILFNMMWVWILLKQIELRLQRWKILLMILVIGIISNVAQYIMSGPYFLGFSGVVVGLAGFIWMRQKYAPWEGYPLPKSTLLFLLFFIVAMFALELFSFGLRLISSVQVTPVIANTAHVVGGIVGLLLGRSSFFGRKKGAS